MVLDGILAWSGMELFVLGILLWNHASLRKVHMGK